MQSEEKEKVTQEEVDTRNFGVNHSSLDFWDNHEEDIYQDFLQVKESKENENRNTHIN